ncbi:MAG: hypothetical protein IKC39_02450 [Clostridia bacterium]|nr:hypothetical protein [Clostridia bacterium]
MQRNIKKPNIKIAYVIIVAVLFMLGSFVAALAQFGNVEFADPAESSEEVSAEVSEVSQEVSDTSKEPEIDYLYYDDLNMESRAFANSAVVNGSLAVVNSKGGAMPVVDTGKLKSVYSVASHKVYGLSGSGLKLYGEAIDNLDEFIVSFYDEVPSNGVIINKAYSPYSAGGSDKEAELSTGYSLQLSIYNSKYKFSDPEFGYLRDQAYRYGVIQRYPDGKAEHTGNESDNTIYRYVGVAHSWYMNLYKYSLEEYVVEIKDKKVIEFDSQLESGVSYVVYYVPIDDGKNTTYVSVPTNENCTYTVSGDGGSGFIVTVKITK